MIGTEPTARARLEAIDILRGLVMIVMALDHTRDFFGDYRADPTDLATRTTALFFTRWITHFCAPVFFLLTGTGAWFSGQRRGRGDLSRFLFTRGLWLIVLEFTVGRFGLQFNVDYKVTVLLVLWALGWSMITLALLVRLPTTAIAVFGALLVAGHNLLDSVDPLAFGALAPVWRLLHNPGLLYADGTRFVVAAYPLVPWIGVTALGYALGQVYSWDQPRRRRFLLRAGLAGCAAFVVLRALNAYGDPRPWAPQASALLTLLSFLNTSKYPPSLLFLLMTLGPSLLLLRRLDGPRRVAWTPALIIGRVPMFYYLVHFLLIHALATAVCYLRYRAVHWMFESPTLAQFPFTPPPGWPMPLGVVYFAWAVVVAAMYPLCVWYADLKRRRGDWWLSYL